MIAHFHCNTQTIRIVASVDDCCCRYCCMAVEFERDVLHWKINIFQFWLRLLFHMVLLLYTNNTTDQRHQWRRRPGTVSECEWMNTKHVCVSETRVNGKERATWRKEKEGTNNEKMKEEISWPREEKCPADRFGWFGWFSTVRLVKFFAFCCCCCCCWLRFIRIWHLKQFHGWNALRNARRHSRLRLR